MSDGQYHIHIVYKAKASHKPVDTFYLFNNKLAFLVMLIYWFCLRSVCLYMTSGNILFT